MRTPKTISRIDKEATLEATMKPSMDKISWIDSDRLEQHILDLVSVCLRYSIHYHPNLHAATSRVAGNPNSGAASRAEGFGREMGNDEPARDASFPELEASLYSALVFQGIVMSWGSEKGAEFFKESPSVLEK
ncbi:predicted protein [Histoplasma capsulatum H143]|uniref:Uncharacterized protein n=1 Tax=Ajellomyces capsulatus (strain H143) TaxID=544712 RepID=C6H1E3_AJECH|nr:predicted protein [Histoplasma capsulatum H143]